MGFQRLTKSYSPTSFSLTVHNRSLRITREGLFFIILVLGIGFAAINTGINLLYLILAMCLSFIIVSGVLSELTLRNLLFTRIIPDEIIAGEPFPVQVKIKNRKKLFPTYSIWVEENRDSRPNIEGSKSHLNKKKDPKIPKIYFYNIKPGDSEKRTVLWTLPKRGFFETKGLKIGTRFPFGFFVKTAFINQPEERVVYPFIKNIEGLSHQFINHGAVPSMKKGMGSDVFGFRKFTYGDSSRMVHWKTSAKVNALMVKEYFFEESKKITIMFDNHIDSALSSMNSDEVSEKFDEGVTQAASLAHHFIHKDYQVKMVTHSQNFPFGRGHGHLNAILHHLALLKPINNKPDQNIQSPEDCDGVLHISFGGDFDDSHNPAPSISSTL
jgi:uncharacterized protein (DUF58 family)